MSDSVKYQQLKFRIYGKTDEEVEAIFKPMEVKFPAVRKLKNSPATYLPLMKYLIFLFDPGTDLNRDFIRLEDRRQEAAKLSGLIKIKDLSYLDRVFSNTFSDSLDVIQILLGEVYHDRKYREWQTLNNELDEYNAARWERIESTKRKKGRKGDEITEVTGHNRSSIETLTLKSKLREECNRIHELLDALDKDLWGDHKDIKDLAYKSRYMNPESFSRAAKQAI